MPTQDETAQDRAATKKNFVAALLLHVMVVGRTAWLGVSLPSTRRVVGRKNGPCRCGAGDDGQLDPAAPACRAKAGERTRIRVAQPRCPRPQLQGLNLPPKPTDIPIVKPPQKKIPPKMAEKPSPRTSQAATAATAAAKPCDQR